MSSGILMPMRRGEIIVRTPLLRPSTTTQQVKCRIMIKLFENSENTIDFGS